MMNFLKGFFLVLLYNTVFADTSYHFFVDLNEVKNEKLQVSHQILQTILSIRKFPELYIQA